MNGRRAAGFTLLEVMIAIVLTSLVVLLAYASAQVSFDTRTRLSAELRAVQSIRAMREVLQDALRNARAPQRWADPRFTLRAGRLSFVAGGGAAPLDPECDWLMTIERSSGGLELVATPVGRAPPAQVTLRLPGVTRLETRVLAPEGSEWLEQWPASMILPRAVAITFWRDSARVGPPLHVLLAARSPLVSEEGLVQP